MDVGAVLREARVRAEWTQWRLATASGAARSTIAAYESGAQSPTVRQLDRLLAACGLQGRLVLEPWSADLDAQLDRAAAAEPPEVLDALPELVSVLRRTVALHLTTKQPTGRIWPPTSWAVDGTTALCLHGLHLAHDCLEIAVLDDEGGRGFLRRVQARGVDAAGFSLMPHWEEPAELARTYVRYPVFSSLGFLWVRLVEQLPPPLHLGFGELTLPVLSLPDIERGNPRLAELLARMRTRTR